MCNGLITGCYLKLMVVSDTRIQVKLLSRCCCINPTCFSKNTNFTTLSSNSIERFKRYIVIVSPENKKELRLFRNSLIMLVENTGVEPVTS